ncbi:unnamed protein product [Pieris macdunnoughi]|uniref:Gag-like protein n=1 Tax=Pieris macdunnoughi TaxID=345717 RepID=A0A821UJL2_9NEOP|nr:unnamed protein product [Pieris macdunnoughi]
MFLELEFGAFEDFAWLREGSLGGRGTVTPNVVGTQGPEGFEGSKVPEAPGVSGPRGSGGPSDGSWATVTKKKKGKGKKGGSPAAPVLPLVSGESGLVGRAEDHGVGHGAGSSAGRVAVDKRPVRVQPSLTPSKTAAVVITLRSEAVERGVTYADVLTKARNGIRLTATEARMLEVPGVDREEKADVMADRLRVVLSEEVLAGRPVKWPNLLIRDLDDSVTERDVAVAVAAMGGCPVDAIKPGKIMRRGGRGIGEMFLLCPVAAAEKVRNGKLLIGWSSCRIEIREDRPLRCYKSQKLGHARATCDSAVDMAEACFRYGVVGHKAYDCNSKELHCAVCSAAGKLAGHKMGGRACNPGPCMPL